MSFMKHPFSLILLAASLAQGVAQSVPAKIEFNRDVRPILSDNCYHCHGNDPSHRKAKLRLDVREAALEQEAFVPGKPEQSQLIERILTDDADELMPPPDSHKRLSAPQKEILKRWIAEGAEYQPHWAFVAPKPVGLPAGLKSHPIDHFIQTTLQSNGLTASPAAEPATLIRRVSLDLTGLPPSPAEVDAFVQASTADAESAYRAVVDRLLGSPHYGERWGRWWLDQARYADSNGYSIDAPRQIWKYRDWVIGAFNADLPFDQFTIEQLAGDLLPEATVDQKVATGFHRNTQINEEGGIDKEQFRIDSVFDRVATTGTVWLGLTIGCAQCHDHKFDPIAQQEYYRLFAFFNNQDEPELRVMDPVVDAGALTAELKDLEGRIKKYLEARADELSKWEAGLTPAAIKSLPPQVRKILAEPAEKRSLAQRRTLGAAAEGGAGRFEEMNGRYQEIDAQLNKSTTTLVMQERPQPRRTTVLIKGDFTRPAEEVTPGTPAVLHPIAKTTNPPNRLDLARWIMRSDNPLTARVMVNRIWQQYFGRGLVVTENDFGLTSTPPSHPELLDWLATTLVDRKWSLKEMHRVIVTSHTYRQSSSARPELREKDPDNFLLARQQRLRLDAEIVRDVALAASGLLSRKLGGPPVYPPIPDGVLNQGQSKRTWKESQGEDKFRRGLYTFVYRASPPPSLSVFDAPEGFTTCTRRIRSNTPLQALTLMNDDGFFEFATALEKIIQKDGLETAFRRCTTRAPKPDELAVLEKLDTLNAARALLNLDETVTRE